MGHRTRVISLPDGRRLTLRPAARADLQGMTALYDALPVDDRRLRFFTASRPSRGTIERLIDATDHGGLWLVAVTDDGRIAADAGYTVGTDGDAEFAITVDEAWRGWLGSHLLDVVLHDAAEHGLHSMRAEVMSENRRMLRLAERHGYARVDAPDPSVVEVTMPTDAERPSWPARHGRRRLLVEGCGGRWHGDAEAWREGWTVVTCGGPDAKSVPVCPLAEGRPCPLVEGADLVVIAARSTATTAQLLVGHQHAGSSAPVLVERGTRPEELSARLAAPPSAGEQSQPRAPTTP
jgi:RimJ/RimL family protein N-acetyltransferase